MRKHVKNAAMKDETLKKQFANKKVQSEILDDGDDFCEQKIQPINLSPGKRQYKRKLQIQLDKNSKYYHSQEIQSQIFDEKSQQQQKGRVNDTKRKKQRVSTYKQNVHQKIKKQMIGSKMNLQDIKSPIHRLSKQSSDEQKRLRKQYSYNQKNNYNQNMQDQNLSRKFLIQYLKNIGYQSGNYLEIKVNNDGGFTPVYRIIGLQNQNIKSVKKSRKVSDDTVIQNNLNLKTKSIQKTLKTKSGLRRSISMVLNRQQTNLDLALGSKVFLKYQKFTYSSKFSITKLRKIPSLQGIYIYIYIYGKGYLTCLEGSQNIQVQQQNTDKKFILQFDDFEDGQKVHSIWKCILAQEQKTLKDQIIEEEIDVFQQQSYVVRFINFSTGKCLSMNQYKQFQIDEQLQKGSKFLLKPTQKSTIGRQHSFTLQKLIEKRRTNGNGNLSREYVSYQEGKKQYFNQKIEIQLTSCQQAFITLQQQLMYIKNKLSISPSLKLIEVVLETVIPYLIPEFAQNISIVSEYIQRLLFYQKISHLMAEYLIQFITHHKEALMEILSCINEEDQINEYSSNKNRSKAPSLYKNGLIRQQSQAEDRRYQFQKKQDSLNKIMKYLNKLCLKSKNNSQVFIIILDLLFNDPLKFSEHIVSLISDNLFFINNLYRREWYHKIIKSILIQKKQNQANIDVFEPYFIILQKFCQYGAFPHIQNQFLIFHTIKQPQFQAKNILLNLYVDGLYIFVHQNNKDLELLTFLQHKSSQSGLGSPTVFQNNRNQQELNFKRINKHSVSMIQRQSKRYSMLMKGSSQVISLNRIVLFLQVLHMLSYGYNYPIVKKYQKIIETLLSYCYKKKFPVIKDYEFIRWVLKCAVAFYQPQIVELNIYPKFKLGIIDSPSDSSKFKEKKFKNSVFSMQFGMLGPNVLFNHTPKIPEREALDMCNNFLIKCKQYYTHIKSKDIEINDIFMTKSVMGEPIQEYFDFLKLLFSNRLLKFKQKKKAQFMQYIQKLFENVFPQNQKVEQNQDTLIIIFMNFLFKIVSYDEEYKIYLQKLNMKVSYNENLIQNPLLMNKKSTVKKLKIFNCDEECTKIMRIKLMNRYFQRENNKRKGSSAEIGTQSKIKKQGTQNSINQNKKQIFKSFQIEKNKNQTAYNDKNPSHTNMNLVGSLSRQQPINSNPSRFSHLLSLSPLQFFNNIDLLQQTQELQKILSLKRKSLQLLILILLNINQEYIEESIETFNYFIKNPTILNWSSFQLFASIPKYERQFGMRKRILQQWYLVSDPQTFELLTTLLRLLHRKVSIHINKISNIEIITDSELSQMSSYISDNFKQIQKMAKSMSSWCKQQHFLQNSQVFGYFDQKLQVVAEMLSKTNELKDCGYVSIPFQIKKMLINLSCLQWINYSLNHIVLEYKRNKAFSSRHYSYSNSKKNNNSGFRKMIKSFVEKISFILNFLTEPIDLMILQSQQPGVYKIQYETNLQYIEAILYVLGQKISQIPETKFLILKIVQIVKTHYDLNFINYLNPKILQNLLSSHQQSLQLFNFIVSCKQHEVITFSFKYHNFINLLEKKKFQQKILQFSSFHKITADTNISYYEQVQNQQSQDEIIYQNSWLCLFYKLSLIRKKYQIQSTKIPLLKFFYQRILHFILQNQQKSFSNQDFYWNSKKGYNGSSKIMAKDITKMKLQIQRKKYIAYFISDFVECQNSVIPLKMQSLKKSTKRTNLGPNYNNLQNYFTLLRAYVTRSFTDLTFLQKIQKSFATESSSKHPRNSILREIQSLILDYSEYFVYDLVSLLYLLPQSQEFDKISENLSRIHEKLIFFLKNSSAGNIQRHYSQIAISKIIKQLEQRKQIIKLKNPRHNFQHAKNYKCVNVQNITFLQPKQIKKLQSTALRKWRKAVKILQNTGIAAQIDFLYEIDHFSQIYNVKNKQELSLIINNQDLLRKLVSVTQNLKRLLKSTQNKIFILSEVQKLIRSKYFMHMVNEVESRESLACIILEQLNQEQLGQDNFFKQSLKWNQNVFITCLKLQILHKLQYFAHQFTLNSLQTLLSLLKKARNTFFDDSLQLRIAQNDFKDVEISVQPFYLILQIICQHIALEYLSQTSLKQIINQLYFMIIGHRLSEQHQWVFDNENKRNYRYGTHRRIQQKIVQKVSKLPRAAQIIKKLSQNYKVLEYNISHQSSQISQSFWHTILQTIEISAEQSSSNKQKMFNHLQMLGL